jgi:uncharacterized protein YcfJ
MEMHQTAKRIHPLVAGAAASVMLVSLVGVAAITGLLPTSHGTVADNSRFVAQPSVAVVSAPAFAVAPAPVQQIATTTAQPQQFALVPVQAQQQSVTPELVREVVRHKTVVHHQYVQHAAAPVRHAQYAQAAPPSYSAPAPVYQQTSANSVSPLGMGVGAVVGGLVGSQVGRGNGKTLATIAGAVGGGYLGNEVAKRYP